MIDGALHNLERRLIILAPTAKDAELTRSILEDDNVLCVACTSLAEVCRELDVGAAVVLLAEENILHESHRPLEEWLRRQPAWSDLPIIVVARPGADSSVVAQAMDLLGNVTVLERPTRVAALVSAVRSAVRARERQYQIRAQMLENERELAAQAMLGAIVESSDDAMIRKNLDGIVQTWNSGAERIFGYTAEEMIGLPITRIIPPDRQAEEPALLARLRHGERIEHFETVRVRKDGRNIDVSLTVSPIRNSQGKVIGASKVARDITARKQTEADLREADRRKDEFLATLAHELRNPLAPIRNSLHILRMTACSDPQALRVCEMMERQVNHMVRLVDDLMELSRITRGLIELRKEHTDLASIIRMAVETSKPLITSAEHELTISLPEDPIPLLVDGVRLAQVFANLLNNAAKYTEPNGRIWLSGRLENSEVVVSVRDNGIGISPKQLPVVFEMFMQADRTNTRTQGGLGIGLTLVRKLVEMHGGTVTAQSEGEGAGSEFVVRLPVAVANPQDVPRQAPVERGATPTRRVLVVDDNEDAASSLAMLLKLLGIEVRIANDGLTALALVEKHHPDVVLLDIGMPEMDGMEVARRIRQRPEFDDILLVALTGWGQEDDRRQTKNAGFDNHLVKPADIATLQSLLMSPKS